MGRRVVRSTSEMDRLTSACVHSGGRILAREVRPAANSANAWRITVGGDWPATDVWKIARCSVPFRTVDYRTKLRKAPQTLSSGWPAISPDDRMTPREPTSGGPISVAVERARQDVRAFKVRSMEEATLYQRTAAGSSPLEFLG